MGVLICDEMTLFMICMLLGAFLAFTYDVIRIIRMLVPHKDVIVDIEDLVFWIFTAWMVFRTLVVYNQGTLRGYAFLGMFLGVLLYAITISKLLLKAVRMIIPLWKKIFRIIASPFVRLNGFVRKMLKNVVAEVKIAIKGR